MDRRQTPQAIGTKNTLPPYQSAKSNDCYAITNSYIPTLSSKKYNVLKLRQLFEHKAQQKENSHLRKKLKLPYSSNGTKLLSKQVTYNCFKPQPAPLPAPYSLMRARNKRTLDFYNCKKTAGFSLQDHCPYLTECQIDQRYEEQQNYLS